MAQKCSLPVREPIPGTNVVPEDVLPKEVSVERMQRLALQAFFYDYSICTVTHSISGGFLGGLETMVRKAGLNSPLADACKAAAFASSGLKLRRKPLLDRAEILYHDLLRYLAKRMQASSASDPEPLAIAILLGLYQV
ncbi:hypothetical protein N7488_006210 [Penicillium malachiteum]|nr:hypothetical protein N7488_006210 [Penicillium malachiteum]